jgi:hypothetical protein
MRDEARKECNRAARQPILALSGGCHYIARSAPARWPIFCRPAPLITKSARRDEHAARPPFHSGLLAEEWAAQNDKLIEYTIKRGKLITKAVGAHSTGYELDLYSFNELDPDVRQYIEQEFFNYADNIAAIALNQHLTGSGEPWSAELLSAWSRFVIGIHLRHRDAVSELRAAAQSIWDGSGEASQRAYDRIRKPEDPVTFDEYLEARDPLIATKMRMNMLIKSFDNDIHSARISTT